MEYKLIRSHRKTMSISVDKDLNVIVRAPMRTTQIRINRFVQNNADWISKRREALRSYISSHPVVTGEYGEKLLFLGVEYTVVPTKANAVALSENEIHIPQGKPVKPQLENWYKKKAREILSERTKLYAYANGFAYKGIRISSARTRYGSCSPENSISYTFRLVMLPMDLIDYVVVHELCHTKYKNHQRDFWNAVSAIMPDWKIRRKRINEDYNIMDCL